MSGDNPWIEWNGGECPLKPSTPHEIKFRDGDIFGDINPEDWRWVHFDNDTDIIAYRVVSA